MARSRLLIRFWILPTWGVRMFGGCLVCSAEDSDVLLDGGSIPSSRFQHSCLPVHQSREESKARYLLSGITAQIRYG